MRRLAAIAIVCSCLRAEAAAPSVQLAIRDGMVWLVARDATLSQVFDEWARVGQTRVVNGDRLTGRITIELAGIPEGQALDALLRTAGGFMAMQRSAALSSSETSPRSQYEQIVITASREPATRVATAAVAPPAAPPAFQSAAGVPIAPGVQRLLGPDGQPVADDQEDAPARVVPRPTPSMPPGFGAPQQRPPQPVTSPTAAPTPSTGQPQTPAGSAVPGMIVPPPAANNAPQPPKRPQGE